MIELLGGKLPRTIELSGGLVGTLRWMERADEAAFREFHSVIPEEEQLFIKSRIRDGSLFHEWMDTADTSEHLALLAFVDGRLVAMGSLHQRMGGWKRHIGKVYFLTHPDYRGLGLLDALLAELVIVAKHFGLTKLESELNGERTVAIESLAAMGFTELARLPDYVRDMKAQPHDYVLMGRDLVPAYENLGTGD